MLRLWANLRNLLLPMAPSAKYLLNHDTQLKNGPQSPAALEPLLKVAGRPVTELRVLRITGFRQATIDDEQRLNH